MRMIPWIAPFVLLAAGVAGPAAAQEQTGEQAPAEVLDLTDPVDLRAALDKGGFYTKPDVSDNGRPLIFVTHDNLSYKITLYDCEDMRDCAHFTLGAFYEVKSPFPIDLVNDWNGREFLGPMWLDDDGFPWLLETVNLIGGLTAEHINDTMLWWEAQLSEFEDTVAAWETQQAVEAGESGSDLGDADLSGTDLGDADNADAGNATDTNSSPDAGDSSDGDDAKPLKNTASGKG